MRKWRRLIGEETHSNKKIAKRKAYEKKGWSQKQIKETAMSVHAHWEGRGGALLLHYFWYSETVVEGMAISWHVVL